jgi:hypothetical protein
VFSDHGHLLGLVTSNTRHAYSGRSFSRLNYSVAAGALRPIWEILLRGDLEGVGLAALDVQSAELSAIWGLKAPPSVLGVGQGSGGAARLSELLRGSGLGQGLQSGSTPSKL